MRDLLRIAARNLLRNQRRTALTALAIAAGVACVIFARAYIKGLHALIRSGLVEGRLGALQVHARGYQGSADALPLSFTFSTDGDAVAAARAQPGVAAVTGRIVAGGMLSNGELSVLAIATAIDPRTEYAVCPKARAPDWVVRGRPLGPGDADADRAVLGAELAAVLGAKPGSVVTLLTHTAAGALNAADLEVVGIVNYQETNNNKRAVTLPLAAAQRLLDLGGRVTELALAARDPGAVDVLARDLAARLPPGRFEVHTWRELAPYLRQVMDLQDRALGFLAAVIFLIALLGIINTMSMVVFERVREIGTLLSLGAERGAIITIFLFEAALLATCAAAAGAAVGTVVVLGMHAGGIRFEIPGAGHVLLRPEVTPALVLGAASITVAGALLGALVPAWRASRLAPVDALRAL